MPSHVASFVSPRPTLTLGLVLSVALCAFESLAVTTILPGIARSMDAVSSYGWVFASFMLASVVGIANAGRLADRHGPAFAMGLGTLAFGAGLVVSGTADGMGAFLAGRVLQGAGSGALTTSVYVAVARAYEPAARARMLAWFANAWVVPAMLGPSLATGIATLFGWRAVFLGLVPLALGAGAMTIDELVRIGPSDERPASAPARRGGWTALAPAVLRAPGRALSAIAVMALAHLAFFAAEAFLPLAFAARTEAPAFAVATTLGAGSLAWTAGAWVAERLGTRMRPRALVHAGLASMAVGLVGVSWLSFASLPVAPAAIAWSFVGFGMGVSYQTSGAVLMTSADEGGEGALSSTMLVANALAVAAGTALGGELALFDAHEGVLSTTGIVLVDGLAALATVAAAIVARPMESASA